MSKTVKPEPSELSQWNTGKEIKYMCPECKTSFAFYGNHENFCHNCGVQVDWLGSPLRCSDECKELYTQIETAYYRDEISIKEMAARQRAVLNQYVAEHRQERRRADG